MTSLDLLLLYLSVKLPSANEGVVAEDKFIGALTGFSFFSF